LVREKGLQETAVEDIAKLAGVDRASIYYYWGDKSEIFREIIRGGLDDLLERLEQGDRALRRKTPADRLRHAIVTVMEAYAEHYPYLYQYFEWNPGTAVVDSALSDDIRNIGEGYEALIASIVTDGVEQGQFRMLLPPKVIAYVVLGMLNWTHRWFSPSGPVAAGDIGAGMAEMVVNGLRDGGDGTGFTGLAAGWSESV
jgi:AcrR family transcriptional regulator